MINVSIMGMKRIILLISFFIGMLNIQAQFSKNHNIYFKQGGSFGNHLGGRISFNYIFKERVTLEAGAYAQAQTSKEKPSDFKGGIFSLFDLFAANEYEHFYLMLGMPLYPDKEKTTRFIFQSGLSYTKMSNTVNFKKVPTTLFGSNYSYDRHSFSTISLHLTPVMEMPFSKVLGLYCSLPVVINKETFTIGVEVGIIGGLLRPKREQSKNRALM